MPDDDWNIKKYIDIHILATQYRYYSKSSYVIIGQLLFNIGNFLLMELEWN